jgi:hypothetical protein
MDVTSVAQDMVLCRQSSIVDSREAWKPIHLIFSGDGGDGCQGMWGVLFSIKGDTV